MSSPPARRTPSRNFSKQAFAHVRLDWKNYVKHDDRYERPAEVDLLIGDSSKATAHSRLGTEGAIPGTGPHHGRCRPCAA